MINIRNMRTEDVSAVLALSVMDDQSAYVDPLEVTLSDSAPTRENFIIEAGNIIVGFFQIDSSSGNQTIPDSIEVHEVTVDAKHQGKGYGKAFVLGLKFLLQNEYPEKHSACLTVNFRNLKAFALYELGAFEDTGEVYLGGNSGPQHIMRLSLK